MTVESVCDRLAELQVLITPTGAVRRAFASPPNALTAADMPCFVNIPGESEYNWIDSGSSYGFAEDRIYRMLLFASPRGSGVPGEAIEKLLSMTRSVQLFFAARPSLGGLAGIMDARIVGDSGVSQMEYAEMQYIGCEFRLKVVEVVQFDYASGE